MANRTATKNAFWSLLAAMESSLPEQVVKALIREWPTVTAAPFVFVLALGIGLTFGWIAAWVVLRQRLVHHKELVEHFEKAFRDKDILPPARNSAGTFTIPPRLMIGGVLILVCAVTLPLYFVIRTAPQTPLLARIQFGPPSGFYHDITNSGQLGLKRFNVRFDNRGNLMARRPLFSVDGDVREQTISDDDVKKEYEKLRSWQTDAVQHQRFDADIDVGMGRVITVPGVTITPEQMKSFNDGNLRIYVFYIISWEDDEIAGQGYWRQEFCGFYQGTFEFFHTCGLNKLERITTERS